MYAPPNAWPLAVSFPARRTSKLFPPHAVKRAVSSETEDGKPCKSTPHTRRGEEESRSSLSSSTNSRGIWHGFAGTLAQVTRRWYHQQRMLMTVNRPRQEMATRQGVVSYTSTVPNRSSFCNTAKRHGQAGSLSPALTREEMIGLLDYYGSEHDGDMEVAKTRFEYTTDILAQSRPVRDKEEREIRQIVARLGHLLRDPHASSQTLAELYNSLPTPGAARLSQQSLDKLLARFARVPHKSHSTMLRYLQLITDMRSAGRHVKVSSWTSAIAFAGRSVKIITASEIESALALWKQMESQAGVRANEVTFNVLFDIASKARKFVLAEMLLQEMKRRGHKFNRYMRVNLMYYHGLRGDGAGVRRSYRELVESGEVVDTAVMSCAVASLLRAGEPVAAEQVFERAKRLHAAKAGILPLPPHRWEDRRELGRSLSRAAFRLRHVTPEERKAIQDTAPLAPGVHAYKALVYYHAVQAGDIARVSALVDEMAVYQIPVQGAIFLHLFKGFAIHGGVLYSAWTRPALESTFQAFLNAVEEAKRQPANASSIDWPEHLVTADDADKSSLHAGNDPDVQPSESGLEINGLSGAEESSTKQSFACKPFSFTSNFDQPHLADRTHISRAACMLCLSAYMRVVDATRTTEVWAQLQYHWAPTPGDREAVETCLVGLEEKRHRWDLRGPQIGRGANRTLARWLR